MFLRLTLALDPAWPLRLLPQTRGYDGHIPALVFPVALMLLLAGLHWSDKDGRFLLLAALSSPNGISMMGRAVGAAEYAPAHAAPHALELGWVRGVEGRPARLSCPAQHLVSLPALLGSGLGAGRGP